MTDYQKILDMIEAANLTRDNPYRNIVSPEFKTEELAELHAIIQAIAYDRAGA